MSGYRVTDLSHWAAGGRQPPILLPAFPSSPPLPVPRDLSFYDALGAALAENPPPAGDRCALRVFAAAGIGPTGAQPGGDEAPPARRSRPRRGGARHRESRLSSREPRQPRPQQRLAGGARYIGRYGRNWLGRAVIGLTALGANTPPETVYPVALTDSRGRPLDGRNRYTVRFERGELPPVGAFWSLTMYGDDLYLVDNPIGRYAIGDRTPGLRRDRDGSLTLHVQRPAPAKAAARANWLPAPGGPLPARHAPL